MRVRFTRYHLISLLVCLSPSVLAQAPAAQPGASPEPVPALQSFTRMVTLEIIAKDSKGNHITGLNADNFQIFEQTPVRGGEKHRQKVVNFREIHMAEVANRVAPDLKMPPGEFSNLIVDQEDPVPPTILLVDGLNTDAKYQAQVHVQMLRMLRSLPRNVPTAVFLLGGGVHMVQDFTTDPVLLQAALSNVESTAGVGIATVDPRDNRLSPGAQMESFKGLIDPSIIEAVKEFDQRVYAGNMDMRVNRTIDALISIARHVAGYPGRKNLLWISTSFPIYLDPIGDNAASADDEVSSAAGTSHRLPTTARSIDVYAGYRNYWAKLHALSGVLSDAKIAVYPINPAGVRTPDVYGADTVPRDTSATGMAAAIGRENLMRASEQDTMIALADGTGGKVCTGDNDLGDCVRKAVEDSSRFYEISYYSDARDWKGEYRRIIVNTDRSGAHLAYRQGYFATPTGADNPRYQRAELQSACFDYLNATSIAFTATSLPPDMPDQLKFALSINASQLTFVPTSEGVHEVNVAVAVCTFNGKGWSLALMGYPIIGKLDSKQYESLLARGELSESIWIPGPRPAAIRLLVRDVPTGHFGSVYINVDDVAKALALPKAAAVP